MRMTAEIRLCAGERLFKNYLQNGKGKPLAVLSKLGYSVSTPKNGETKGAAAYEISVQ